MIVAAARRRLTAPRFTDPAWDGNRRLAQGPAGLRRRMEGMTFAMYISGGLIAVILLIVLLVILL